MIVYSLKWMIVYTKFHLDWLLYAVSVSYMPSYVPIIMHGLRLFYKNYNVYNVVYMLSYRYLSLHQVLFIYTFQFLRLLQCLPLLLVYALKCMCIPSLILIGFCVSEPIYSPIIMYGLGLFIVVLQCLQCCLHVDIIRVIGIYHFTKLRLQV